MLIAQLPTIGTDALGQMIVGLVAVAVVGKLVIDIWDKVRRKPPLEASFAGKPEFDAFKADVSQKLGDINTRVMFAASNGDFAEFQRSVATQLAESHGRILGQLDRQGQKLDDLREDLQLQLTRIAGELHGRINETRERLSAVEAKQTSAAG